MTCNALTYYATVIYYMALNCAGYPQGAGSEKLPGIEKFKVGLAAVSAIGFMQLSLLTCPLTFYQIYKVRVPALARYRPPS